MPTGRVSRENEVFLNGKLYPIQGPVRRYLASAFPEKFVLGDYGPDSSRIISSVTVDDWRPGLGLHTAKLPDDLGRTSYSTADMSQRGHLTLPSLATATAAFATSAAGAIGAVELSNVVYAATSVTATTVQSYNNGTDAWTDVRTLATAPTDIKVGKVGPLGSITLCVATGSEVDYSTNGSSWSRNTTDIKFICFWNDFLWGIDNAGTLYFTEDLSGAWKEVARLPYPAGTVSKLFVGHNAAGDSALYIASKVGLHIYDSEKERIVDTPLILPYHPAGGAAATEWATTGLIYYSAGLAVYEYSATAGAYRSLEMETFEAFEGSSGINYDAYSWVVGLSGSLTHLLAFLGNKFDGVAHPAGTGSDVALYVRRWNKRGWDEGAGVFVTISGGTTPSYCYPLISNTYSTYRLWAPALTRLQYAQLQPSLQAPSQTVSWTYYNGNRLVFTPWFVNNTDQNWIIVEAILDSVHPTASETIALAYATDFTESYTTIATKSATGLTRYSLPPSGDTVGVAFRAIKFRFVMNRGSTATNTPDLKRFTFVYHKSPKVLWGFEFVVKGSENYNNMTPRAIRENLETAVASTTLVEFTFKGESDASESHFVQVHGMDGSESTGMVSPGDYRIRVEEVL